MDPHQAPEDQQRLCDFVINQVTQRTSGRAALDCEKNNPRDVYFVGCLRSGDAPPNSGDAHFPELMNKLAPVAFGAEFRLSPAGMVTIALGLRWSCYYRIFPTWEQQRDHLASLTSGREPGPTGASREVTAADASDDGDEGDDSGPPDDTALELAPAEAENGTGDRRSRNDVLMLRFRKIECYAEGTVALRQDTEGVWTADCAVLLAAIDGELTRARAAVAVDQESIRTADDPYAPLRVPEESLRTEAAYSQYTRTLRNPVVPGWQWDMRIEAHAVGEGEVQFSALFANQTSRQLSSAGRDHPCLEAFLFDVGATFAFDSCVVRPFTIELAPKGFRYDRHVGARPFNCAVEQVAERRFETTHVPVFKQLRLQTQASPAAPFSGLAKDPIPLLDSILRAMESFRDEWGAAEARFAASVPEWAERHFQEFAADRDLFEEEIQRFRTGRNLIAADADIRTAFQLTNETFSLSGAHTGKTAWRLFQIVFLVSQIPGLAALAAKPGSSPADLERADIIYFPTGGGKTEAYLSVIAFHCFFDRLRGKTAGVTAWTRFPLRLLTLQQTQRAADVICVADLVRRQHPDPRLSGPQVAGFGVGYFVGRGSTPNEIVDTAKYRYPSAEDTTTWAAANDDAQRQSWRRLIHCPSCWTATVRVEFDAERVRLIHRCSRPECRFPEGRIPVYVVDNEIYRYLPSVLVGTIDKLAGVGNQRKFAQIFGAVDGHCRQHGFYKSKCCQKECDGGKHLIPRVPAGLSGPTLLVQDELHLLKEGLGTFDGHYETFMRELLAELSPGSAIKIIASSATIENFSRQVEHLYGRSAMAARIFPGPGPTLGASFYAMTLNYPQRIYVGVIPHNKTIFNAMLELLEHYHSVIQELMALPAGTASPFGGGLSPGTSPWFDLLDLYVTSLTYFLSSRDLHSVHTDLDGHVSPLLEGKRLSPLRISELTGSTSTEEVATTLEDLARAKPRQEGATAVLATNMVSHGVDIDRLNAMFFYGMPRQNAEYIQASSRVGRLHMGLVFVCHHPARERDQSHYSVFGKYHEYLGQMVEPVAINRWATFSINRTLPGLFMGVLLQLLSNRADARAATKFYMIEYVRSQIQSGGIRADDFVPLLERAYGVTQGNDVARVTFREEIRLRVREFLDQVVGAGPSKKFVSEVLIPRPMLSLRDVDEPIPVALDRAGSQWSGQFGE